MLKTLIKRDGTPEAIDARKLNGWGEWAANELGNRIDWSQAAMAAVSKMPEVATTRELMQGLIAELLAIESWPAYMMAGRLKASVVRKDLFDSIIPPTIQELHKSLQDRQLMRPLPYSDAEYAQLQEIIDHTKDYNYPEFALSAIMDKYSIRNYTTKEVFETPQFVYMRMAMTVCEYEPDEVRMDRVVSMYESLANKMLSAPTPNYLFLGTHHRGYASCCLYTAADDSESLAVGDHIAYRMTVNSAGIGNYISTRAPGAAIDGGRVMHSGKFRYYKAAAAAVLANKQAARAGAGNFDFSAFDPEAITTVQYRNPLQVDANQIRDVHFTMMVNKFFISKAAKNEDIFSFNEHTAKDLHDAFFSPDIKEFVRLYKKYEADPNFKKNYHSARDLVAHSYSEAFDTGTAYLAFMDEVNHHTPYIITNKERINCLNLCVEVAQVTAPYYSMVDLYSSIDHGRGEISMCNLAAIPVDNVTTDEEYAQQAYNALKMIDYTILHGEYPFPHLAVTAKARMNAGVGIAGLATHMARKGLRWDTVEGKQEIHRVYERHMYWLIKASIRISKERGLAPWIHKTKWPQGWTPMKTYNRNVDKIAPFTNVYDWDALSEEIIANGGIAHSIVANMMPGESSSKALGATPSVYQVPSLTITKKDGENNISRWAAVDGDLLGDAYHLAYDVSSKDQIEGYAIGQKWCDGAISADEYRKFSVGETEVEFTEYFGNLSLMASLGMKSRYYMRTRRPKSRKTDEHVSLIQNHVTPTAAKQAADVIEKVSAGSKETDIAHEGQAFIDPQPTGAVVYEDREIEDACGPDGFCKM